MSNNKAMKETCKENTVMTAVALQDHIARSLSLKDPFKKRSFNHRKPTTSRKNQPLQAGKQEKQEINKSSCKSKQVSCPVDVERILDPTPQPLTLAQKLGVVAAPEPPLSEQEWNHVKHFSNSRDDSLQPCAICQENFGMKDQVLLSCSHVFHRVCLHSFEKYSGKKSCPMCRKERYQTRLIYEGKKIHLIRSAIKIQACWRGYKVRCWYKKIRENVAPKDPRLRKAFFEQKLTSLTEKMVDSLDQYASEVDCLINSANENLAYSKNILSQLENPHSDSFIDWKEIHSRARSLNILECPICMMSFKDQAEVQESRAVALLSCSHVYHFVCLQMYEDCYSSGHPHCPVCRTVYLKIKLQNIFEEEKLCI